MQKRGETGEVVYLTKPTIGREAVGIDVSGPEVDENDVIS
jgi:hypothetical protein